MGPLVIFLLSVSSVSCQGVAVIPQQTNTLAELVNSAGAVVYTVVMDISNTVSQLVSPIIFSIWHSFYHNEIVQHFIRELLIPLFEHVIGPAIMEAIKIKIDLIIGVFKILANLVNILYKFIKPIFSGHLLRLTTQLATNVVDLLEKVFDAMAHVMEHVVVPLITQLVRPMLSTMAASPLLVWDQVTDKAHELAVVDSEFVTEDSFRHGKWLVQGAMASWVVFLVPESLLGLLLLIVLPGVSLDLWLAGLLILETVMVSRLVSGTWYTQWSGESETMTTIWSLPASDRKNISQSLDETTKNVMDAIMVFDNLQSTENVDYEVNT